MEPFPYVILSDGCSGGKKTDIGSRILCQLAYNSLLVNKDNLGELGHHRLGFGVIQQALTTAKSLQLPSTSLDATLIVAFQYHDWIRVFIYGDGYVFCRSHDDDYESQIVSYKVLFTKSAPYYLIYEAIPTRRYSYMKERYEGKPFKRTVVHSNLLGRVEETIDEVIIPLVLNLHVRDFKTIMISSDGIGTFSFLQNKSEVDMFYNFSDIKASKGKFMQRRAGKVIERYEKEGHLHEDDISIGGFFISKE